MPRIPEYQQQVQSVQAPALQAQATGSIEAFGGGQDLAPLEASVKFAQGQESQFVEYKKQADNSRVMASFDALTKAKNNLIFDPKSGAMTKKGQDAATVTQDYGGQFNKLADQIAENLTNDDQRAMFMKVRSKVGEELNQTLEKHTYSETEAYQKEVISSTLKTVQDDATLNYYQPGKIPEAVAKVKAMAVQQANTDGIHEAELVSQRTRAATSKLYSGVLDRMMATEDPGARGFYTAIQGDMTAEDRERIDKTLHTSAMQSESQSTADKLNAQYPKLSDALSQARQLPPGEMRTKVIQNLTDIHEQVKKAKDIDDNERFDQASDIVEQSGGYGRIPVTLTSGMSPKLRQSLEERARQLKSGVDAVPAGQQYYDLLRTATASPQTFAKLNLRQYAHSITPSELSELMKSQTDISQGKGNSLVDGFQTTQQVVQNNIALMGIKKDPVRSKAYEDEVDRQVIALEKQLGRKATKSEVQPIADSLAGQVRVQGGGWLFGDSKPYLFERNASDSNRTTVDFDAIPAYHLKRITRVLMNNGIVQPTQKQIIDAYKNIIGAQSAR